MCEQELKIIPPHNLVWKMSNGLIQEIKGVVDISWQPGLNIYWVYFYNENKEIITKKSVPIRLVFNINWSLVSKLILEKIDEKELKKTKLETEQQWIELLTFVGALIPLETPIGSDVGHYSIADQYRMFYDRQSPQTIEQIDITETANPKRESEGEN